MRKRGSPRNVCGRPIHLAMGAHSICVGLQDGLLWTPTRITWPSNNMPWSPNTMPLWASIPVHNPNAWLSTRVCGAPREELRGYPSVCVAAQCCRALAVHTRPRLATRGISWVCLEGRGPPYQDAWTQSGRAICLAWAPISQVSWPSIRNHVTAHQGTWACRGDVVGIRGRAVAIPGCRWAQRGLVCGPTSPIRGCSPWASVMYPSRPESVGDCLGRRSLTFNNQRKT